MSCVWQLILKNKTNEMLSFISLSTIQVSRTIRGACGVVFNSRYATPFSGSLETKHSSTVTFRFPVKSKICSRCFHRNRVLKTGLVLICYCVISFCDVEHWLWCSVIMSIRQPHRRHTDETVDNHYRQLYQIRRAHGDVISRVGLLFIRVFSSDIVLCS